MMDLLHALATIAYATILMCMLLDFEAISKEKIYKASLLACIVISFDTYVWIKFGYNAFMRLYPFIVHIPHYILFLFFSRYKGIKLFFVQLTVIVLSAPPILIGLFVASFYNYNAVVINIICLIIYLPILLIVFKYFRPSFLYMLRNSQKGWAAFCLIPLSYSLLFYFSEQNKVEVARVEPTFLLNILSLILVLSSFVIIIRSFMQTREQLVSKNEQDVLRTQVTAAQAHLEALKESEEKTIIYRHDLRHHLLLIDAYLDNKDIDKAIKYIAGIQEGLDNVVLERYSDNYAVNLILSSYINKAKSQNITVEADINIPQETFIVDMDLCVILANSLENAINACDAIQCPKNRRINIMCKVNKKKLYIQISNSFIGEVEFGDEIPLSKNENHGFGTKSIASITRKYQGMYSFTAQNGVFTASVII